MCSQRTLRSLLSSCIEYCGQVVISTSMMASPMTRSSPSRMLSTGWAFKQCGGEQRSTEVHVSLTFLPTSLTTGISTGSGSSHRFESVALAISDCD